MINLFEKEINSENSHRQPLAFRMCPLTLEQFVGQSHILGEGKLLRRAIEADRISSLILFGPPGTGKTALARIIAARTKAHFEWINAASATLDDLRRVIRTSKTLKQQGIKTILFLDEIHRFNKLQQDSLLPDVEEGGLTLIAATVENPFFYINSALLSRSLIFELKPLSEEETFTILNRALQDKKNGLGKLKIAIDESALRHISKMSDGDARKALTALEIAVLTTPPDNEGMITINLSTSEESIQKKAIIYDKKGDQHYDTASAFIKSMRGSDPDATIYYLAKMLYAGEDPRFIARRIVICAAEDVGNADPMAIVLAVSALKAVEFIGMPEARIPLAQAAIYIAKAPKSNASYIAIEKAMDDIARERTSEVPEHLKDSHYPGAKKLGRGKDYKYPHDYGGYVEQDYLTKNKKFYSP